MIEIMDIPEADVHSAFLNQALKYTLADRMSDISFKRCYMCDGWGHLAEKCPTAHLVREIADTTTFPKLKACITAAIGAMKDKSFAVGMAHQPDNSKLVNKD
jgi:hypothetical protein